MHDLKSFQIKDLYDNPYIRVERLDYLESITGIVSALDSGVSTCCAASSLRPVRIDLHGFDALITTCPLNIEPRNLPIFVQTIHDLIPLEYVAHNEDQLMFSHRLQACLTARRLFVSQSTANKYNAHIKYARKPLFSDKEQKEKFQDAVIIQSPPEFPKLANSR